LESPVQVLQHNWQSAKEERKHGHFYQMAASARGKQKRKFQGGKNK
jgi:hypothetical protein